MTPITAFEAQRLKAAFQTCKETIMEIFRIKKSEEGKRLDQFLMEQKHWPRAFFMKALRTKKIKVNGRKEEAAFRLSAGDEVRSFVLEKRDALRPVRILYEDENLLVVYKPAGLLTLDITGKEKDTMLSRVSSALMQKGGVAAYPVHRIDFNTEGLLLFAKTEEIRDLLGRLIRDRKISKFYLAIVLGKIEPGHGTLTHQIFKDAKKNQVFVTDEPVKGSKTAITEYERLAYQGGLSLVKCHLITGRTHQIRSQMAHVGHPLLGDDKYGVKTTNRSYKEKRQLLCSAEISCDFGKEAGPLSYLAGTRWSVGDVGFVKKYFGGQ